MATTRKIIPSGRLRVSDVPPPGAQWHRISSFALTYDPHEMGDYGQYAGNLDRASSGSSLSELRAHLYVEQRRWNHFGRDPDDTTMKKIQEIIALIRQKLAD